MPSANAAQPTHKCWAHKNGTIALTFRSTSRRRARTSPCISEACSKSRALGNACMRQRIGSHKNMN